MSDVENCPACGALPCDWTTNPHTPQIYSPEDRERVARIIDPTCFDGRHPYPVTAANRQRTALAKADEIIAYFEALSSPMERGGGDHGSSGGRVQAAPDGATARQWIASEEPQPTDCIINGFYHVYPKDLMDPPAAYVFGRENAHIIASALSSGVLPDSPNEVSAGNIAGDEPNTSSIPHRGQGDE